MLWSAKVKYMKPKHLGFETESATYGRWPWERQRRGGGRLALHWALFKDNLCVGIWRLYFRARQDKAACDSSHLSFISFFPLSSSSRGDTEVSSGLKELLTALITGAEDICNRGLYPPSVTCIQSWISIFTAHTWLQLLHVCRGNAEIFNLSPGTRGSNVDCMTFHVRVGHGWLRLMSFLWT